MPYNELERLICAGAISPSFRQQLMSDPGRAVQRGYLGQTFHLNAEELRLITNVRANDFEHFAEQIARWIRTHRNGYHTNGDARHNGNGHRYNGNGKSASHSDALFLSTFQPRKRSR